MAKRRKLAQKRRAVPGPPPTPAAKHQQHQQQKTKKTDRPSQGKATGHEAPTIPFSPDDAILLVGEGDLSFAASLVEHHGCARVTATVLEKSLSELRGKYPHAGESVDKVEAAAGRVLYGVDARRMGPWLADKKSREPRGAMDRVIFNFPHVGGKSTDVNRQVRYNQELLVDFFGRALLSLAPGGSIIVTLFEGEPYTLWNIRDLGRHAGLQVERSFRFQAAAYPGYRHARTLGVVRSTSGEPGGGWKGEHRAARTYIFVRKDDVPVLVARKRKRAPGDDDDSGSSSGDDG